MIYIEHLSKTIEMPRHELIEVEKLSLILINLLTKEEVILKNLVNISETNQLYLFNIEKEQNILNNLSDGEYNYILYETDVPDNILESGIIVIGNYKRKFTDYKHERKIIQYNNK